MARAGEEERLERADGILRECASANATAYWSPSFGEPVSLRHSLYYGDLGVVFVRALVAHSRGDAKTYEQQVEIFCARCVDLGGCVDEVLLGAAGLLNGARILYCHTGDERASNRACALSDHLVHRAGGPLGWILQPNSGFGHGAAGILHALLSWARCSVGARSSSIVDLLAAYGAGIAPHERRRLAEPMRSGWCNGAAGEVLLWARAYELTRRASDLARARDEAERVVACRDVRNPDLCCGTAGRAYALLAMERVDSGNGWLARAQSVAPVAMLARSRMGRWPLGLFKGLPGIASMALDLTSQPEQRRGFPLIE